MNLKEILNKIFEVDKEMDSTVEQIDINQPNWLDAVKNANDSSINRNKTILTDLTTNILKSFEKFTEIERVYFWNYLSKTKHVKYSISSDFLIDKSIDNLLLLEIIINLMPDPRDRLLYLNELIEEFDHHKIDYKPIINRLLKYADNKDWSGMGSMKTFLENVIENN